MSTTSTADKMANVKPKKVVVPKVWKRPHSTIYGKNVEFGSKLYSDKLGEINGRKFNSELPWQMRNSGGASSTSGSSTSQGYLSKLFIEPHTTLIGSVITSSSRGGSTAAAFRPTSSGLVAAKASANEMGERWLTPASCANYADVLELTNPNRYSKRRAASPLDRFSLSSSSGGGRLVSGSGYTGHGGAATATNRTGRIDFYESYLEFNDEIRRMNESSRLLNDPLMQRRAFDEHLDFNYELGLFVPAGSASSSSDDGRSALLKKTLKDEAGDAKPPLAPSRRPQAELAGGRLSDDNMPTSSGVVGRHERQQILFPKHDHRRFSFELRSDINPAHFDPVITTTKKTDLLPKHACQLADSPYGPSADGRKLSLGSINPHSYRPSLPHKTTTVHASDGEEFEFQDRSSPFFTDR
jgi:hypothetical protein